MFWTLNGKEFDPFAEVRQLQREMNRLFADMPTRSAQDFPAVNVWTGQNGYVVTAELPGVSTDELDISVIGDTVTIKGERRPDEIAPGESYHRRERGFGKFTRSFKLPRRVDAKEVQAEYRKGILKVTLPRAEEDKPKRIPLKTA
ncbi:MAG: Hsp20/alpha crystallin family protein [Candidatus Riflebacteria bacterium]|nr:Hsp20/alpha crystallin family protein [Candidatus Riflebacteria bacterium]